MIRKLSVSNYKSIGEQTEIEFGALTVLVGPNGCGKSNLLNALLFVSDAVTKGLDAAIVDRGGIGAIRRWSSGRPFNVSVALAFELGAGMTAEYQVEISSGEGKQDYRLKREEALVRSRSADGFELDARYSIEDGVWHGPANLRPELSGKGLALSLLAGDERFSPLGEALRDVDVYAIFPDALRFPQKPDSRRPMRRHGENWASVLRDLPDPAKADLQNALLALTADIEDFHVTSVGGFLAAQFKHRVPPDCRRAKWLDAGQESDGTLRVAGVLTALLQEPAPFLIGVEEPELTVHVGAVRLLHDFLEAAARGGRQIIITTHCLELLDLFAPEDVRVVTKEQGVTAVALLDPSQRQVVRERLMTLGEVARTEGLRPETAAPEGGSSPAGEAPARA